MIEIGEIKDDKPVNVALSLLADNIQLLTLCHMSDVPMGHQEMIDRLQLIQKILETGVYAFAPFIELKFETTPEDFQRMRKG